MKYTITLTAEQEAALKTDMISIQDWIDNAIQNKLRRTLDGIVVKSRKGSQMTPKAEKEKIISDLIKEGSPLLKSAHEKNQELKK